MSSIHLLSLHLLLRKVCLGLKLTKVLKNNASSKDTDGKIPKHSNVNKKVTKMSKTVKERMDR